ESLKEATKGRGRVFSLSLKDRSAVLLAGRKADGCYWFDPRSGTFVSSTFYKDLLPGWLTRYNNTAPADRYFRQRWTKLRPDLDYERYSSPDDTEGESPDSDKKRTFPHPLTGGEARPGAASREALVNSPFGNDLLLELAMKLIEEEDLGREKAPDLLTL